MTRWRYRWQCDLAVAQARRRCPKIGGRTPNPEKRIPFLGTSSDFQHAHIGRRSVKRSQPRTTLPRDAPTTSQEPLDPGIRPTQASGG